MLSPSSNALRPILKPGLSSYQVSRRSRSRELSNIQMLRLCNRLAHIPLFLYPFLNTTSKTRPFEYLRLTSLGVIGALVKVSKPKRTSADHV